VVQSLVFIPLGNHCWVCWWKNFENRSMISKVINKSSVLFFWLTGYVSTSATD